ncbi:DUF6323 family protein [Adlercreutzia sp. ZJ141]|uniref:DUF6323 family protein n=1 Tax=Adlercreutzia sp. ZJ141 TaxID=2709406 RepID=UPI0013EC0F90|nr:DUF6323 family protein [Adlercreutzia sp. ZJ141]
MDANAWLSAPARTRANSMLAEVNGRLAAGGLSISCEDARMLAERRDEALRETGRVEFGVPAIAIVTEAVATSPCLLQDGLARDLADLQDAFYAIRDELPADVPDTEIAESLRGCLDAWGDVATVTSMPSDEIMRFSAEYVRVAEAENYETYRITDDEGHIYTFDPVKWDYDEQADGWNGEGWADDWDD